MIVVLKDMMGVFLVDIVVFEDVFKNIVFLNEKLVGVVLIVVEKFFEIFNKWIKDILVKLFDMFKVKVELVDYVKVMIDFVFVQVEVVVENLVVFVEVVKKV